jgi:transposase
MSGVSSIEVKESVQELEQLLLAQTNLKRKERLQVLYLLKLPNQLSVSQIAKVIGKHRGSVQRWLAIYRDLGLDALLEIKQSSGRPRVIPAWATASLQRRLEQAEHGFKSYIQVQQWLEDILGVKAEYRTVHQLTHYRLKAKLKAARPTSTKQDSQQTEAFKKTLQIT